MKRSFWILILSLFGICNSTFAQDRTITFQISVLNDGKLEAPNGVHGITKDDYVWQIVRLRENCVQDVTSCNPGAIVWQDKVAATTFRINLNVFNTCGGWVVGEDMELRMTINKPGSPLDGASAVCKFTGATVSWIQEQGVVFGMVTTTVSVLPSSLELCQGAASGNSLTATVSDGSTDVVWELADGSGIPNLIVSGTKADFSKVPAGNYTVVAKSGSIKSAAVPVTIKSLPVKPQIQISPEKACAGEEVTVRVSNPEAGVEYAWIPAPKVSTSGSTALFDAVSSSVLYQVTPTLNGCQGQESNQVNVTLKPELTVQEAEIACKVDHYEATVVVSTPDVSAYTDLNCTMLAKNVSWIGGNKAKFADLSFGTHIYYLKGESTCGVATVVVDDKGSCACGAQLAIAMNDGSEFCEGETVKPITITLTRTAEFKTCSFNLIAPDGSAVFSVDRETKTSWTYSPTQSGTYHLEDFASFDADGNSCGVVTGTGEVKVTINPRPAILSFTASKNEGCYGEDLHLEAVAANGTGKYEYIWTGSGVNGKASTVDMTVQAGDQVYQVQAKDEKGCFSEVSEEKHVVGYRVEVLAKATPQTVANGKTAVLGSSVTLTPKENKVAAYNWQPANQLVDGNSGAENPVTVGLTEQQEYILVVTDNHGCVDSAKTTVNVSGGKLAVTAEGASGCYGTTLTLKCTPSGGTGGGILKNYNYQWSPGEGLVLSDVHVPQPTVDLTTEPGKYTATVTVTDEVNNVTSEVVEVIVKQQPKLNNILATPSSGLNSVTSNLTVEVQPAEAKLAWYPPERIATGVNTKSATTQLLTESQTFTVRASLDGCFDEKTVEVNVSTQEIHLTAVGSEGCANTRLTVEANPSGGVPGTAGYQYLWGESVPAGVVLSNNTVKKPTIQNSAALKPGTYSIPVTVSDSKGQSKEANVVVVIYGEVKAVGNGFCKDENTFDGQIELSNGVVPYSIYSDAGTTNKVTDVIWNETQTVAILENLSSGSAYTYYVKDKNGCNTARVDLTADCKCGAQLVMTLGPQVCALSGEDIEITLLASGGSSYSFDLINVELGTKVLEVKNEAKSSWTHKVKYADRGKYRIDHFEAVSENPELGTCSGNVVPKEVDVKFFSTPKVEAGPDIPVCGTGTVTLKANGDTGLTYTWDHGVEDGVPFTPPMGVPTTYTVRGTDANGCWKEDQVVVTANFKPTVSAMASPNVICKGEVVNLSHNGTADTYTWDNGGQDGPNNMPEATTRYIVTGTSVTTGCSDTASIVVIVNEPAEIVEAPKDRTIAIGKDATFSVKAIGNNLSYEWKWYNVAADSWNTFVDNTASTPKVSGSATETLTLEQVPQSWDGRKLKCVVKGDCGDPKEAVVNLWVKECFDIVADLQILDGIQVEQTPGAAVDGWFCKGNRISLKALVSLVDPQNGMVTNPHYTWTIDGLPAAKVIESDSSVLSWVPEYYEDDIVVKVCIYSDGACNEACSKHIRLKARAPDDVQMQIVTSVDLGRLFCPGDTVNFTVALKNGGVNPTVHWYRDIFDKGVGVDKAFAMDQKDTWVKAVFEPGKGLCVEKEIADSVFLRVKEYVNPTLRIENNIGDTIACQGDSLVFHAVWSDAGSEPRLQWQQDIWNRGSGEYALIGLNDKDTWVKCVLTPGNDVCYAGPLVIDTMVIRVREAGTLTITCDMQGKHPGDELLFESKVEGMTGTWEYNWYVNGNQTICEEESYMTDLLRQGDIVDASVKGNKVCLNKIFSNKIRVDYEGYVSRDTMLVIYADEKIKDLDMVKEGDDITSVLFRVETQAAFGMASFTPEGKFTYIPNSDFVGTDFVKYVIVNKQTKEIIAEGYIYITVKDSKRFLVPNLITPNDDGLNDTWMLDFLADYPNHRITVFDRNGHIVLESTSYQSDWDGSGYNKGGYVAHTNLLNGVYTYVIELGDKDKTVLKSWIEIRANLNRRNYR